MVSDTTSVPASRRFKAVVFDVGGVIEINEGTSPVEHAAEALGVPLADFRKTYQRLNHLSNVENLLWEDVFVKVVAEYSDDPALQERMRAEARAWMEHRVFNTELLELFPMIKRQGLKVGILSNATNNLRERLAKKNILQFVDALAVSGEIGFQKPHREAFQAIFDMLGVEPRDAIFVDDTPRSLEKAEEIGYTPILFKNNAQLISDLQNLGIQTA